MILSAYIQQQILAPTEIATTGNPDFEQEANLGWVSQKEAAHAHYLVHFVPGNTAKELAAATGRSTSSVLAWLKKNALPTETGIEGGQTQWVID
jgi:hypothetical protein